MCVSLENCDGGCSECQSTKPMANLVRLTCSHRPRASVQKGDKGHQFWKLDLFHVQRSGTATLCGRDCSEWLRIGQQATAAVLKDGNCCSKCAAQLRRAAIDA